MFALYIYIYTHDIYVFCFILISQKYHRMVHILACVSAVSAMLNGIASIALLAINIFEGLHCIQARGMEEAENKILTNVELHLWRYFVKKKVKSPYPWKFLPASIPTRYPQQQGPEMRSSHCNWGKNGLHGAVVHVVPWRIYILRTILYRIRSRRVRIWCLFHIWSSWILAIPEIVEVYFGSEVLHQEWYAPRIVLRIIPVKYERWSWLQKRINHLSQFMCAS